MRACRTNLTQSDIPRHVVPCRDISCRSSRGVARGVLQEPARPQKIRPSPFDHKKALSPPLASPLSHLVLLVLLPPLLLRCFSCFTLPASPVGPAPTPAAVQTGGTVHLWLTIDTYRPSAKSRFQRRCGSPQTSLTTLQACFGGVSYLLKAAFEAVLLPSLYLTSDNSRKMNNTHSHTYFSCSPRSFHLIRIFTGVHSTQSTAPLCM